jgi:hypothetical protein
MQRTTVGLGFRVWGLGVRVWDLGSRVGGVGELSRDRASGGRAAGAKPTNQPCEGVPGPRLAVPVFPATGTPPREAGPAMPKEAESARPERTTWAAAESGWSAIWRASQR